MNTAIKFLVFIDAKLEKLYVGFVWVLMSTSLVAVLPREVEKRKRCRKKPEIPNKYKWQDYVGGKLCPLEESKWVWEQNNRTSMDVLLLIRYLFVISIVLLALFLTLGKNYFDLSFSTLAPSSIVATFCFISACILCLYSMGVYTITMPTLNNDKETYTTMIDSYRMANSLNGEVVMFQVDLKRSILRYFLVGFISLLILFL